MCADSTADVEHCILNIHELLRRFAAAVEAGEGGALGELFTPEGIYDDGFYGVHAGRAAIAAMLGRFHAEGCKFRWVFLDPICSGPLAYARYCFSYSSLLAGSIGRPVVFEGMSQFCLRDGLIVRYSEVFDRGVAMVQLGFAPDRISRALARLAERQAAPR